MQEVHLYMNKMKAWQVKTPVQHIRFLIAENHCNSYIAEAVGCSEEVVKKVKDKVILEELERQHEKSI